ncbi:MAG: hypothetical protein DMF67_02960 [Acidobacteria bacterium]|nr:MAG: hypothetical protein DMF67_02960 [Acidobacteriota bacterium]
MISAQNLMPVIPQPPHDPTWLLLNARVGWSESKLTGLDRTPPCGALALAPEPGSLPSLTEQSGSFGGLKLPTNVAQTPDGGLYLLDAASLRLKRFDPCECVWKIMPRFGGAGSGPRQLNDPHGVGICGGNLFVCDTGNRRLSIFSLRGYVLRGTWSPPASAKLKNTWEPYAVTFDGAGRAYVSDGANGCVHQFTPYGQWERCFAGFGKVTHVAIDCQDRLYAVSEGVDNEVRVVDASGQELEHATRVDALAARFPRLPFRVDAEGNLHLSELCSGSQNGERLSAVESIFDTHGKPTEGTILGSSPRYVKKGAYLSAALDSELYRCQWHRIVLRGCLPPGTRLRVRTYTAEALLTEEQLDSLLAVDDAWETKQTAQQFKDCEWDCLVASGEGRYLWLRLEFEGGGAATPEIESIRIEFPRISLRRYLPGVFGEDPSGASFTDRFLSIFDTTFRNLEHVVDEQACFFDPLSTPSRPDARTGVDFLSWLGTWIGLTLDRQWPERKRRALLKRAAQLFHIRGTREGLRRLLLFNLDMTAEARCCADSQSQATCTPQPANCAPEKEQPCAWQPPPLILEHYQLRRWLFVGAGRLGDQAVLWGKRIANRSQLDQNAEVAVTLLKTTPDPFHDPFGVYAHKFSVFVPAAYGQDERRRKSLENILNAEKPAHTEYQLVYVEPRFRVGVQAMIGFDSVVGRYPTDGVRLGAAPLGRASVLTGPKEGRGGASLTVGSWARVGTTTKLD